MLKENPWFPQSADPLSPEAVNYLLSLKLPNRDDNIILLQEKAYLCWTVYAAMRTSDVHEIHSHLLTVIPAAKGLPRRYRTVLQTTKNDPDGTGPIANREYFVPCDCLTRLTAAEKRSFTMKVKANPDHPCEFPTCPFHDYLTLCPSPFGTEGRILKFMRARTTQGNVGFTLGTMGKHKIVEMMARLNSLLPPHLQVARVTGHSGRHTAASIAVNSGVDSSMIAKVTPIKTLAPF